MNCAQSYVYSFIILPFIFLFYMGETWLILDLSTLNGACVNRCKLSTYTILSLFSLYRRTRSSSLVTLARPSVSSSLQITNRSFTYASPYMWNQLPSSFRQPHSVHCPPGSPHPARITSSQSPPSLSSPITASTFHSRLKTSLPQIISSIVTLIPPGLTSRILTCTELKGHWFVCFSFWLRVLD